MARFSDAELVSEPGPEHYPIRRRPHLPNFLFFSGGLGLVVGLLIGYFGPDAPNSSLLQETILLGAVGLVFGASFGAIFFLIAERRSLRD